MNTSITTNRKTHPIKDAIRFSKAPARFLQEIYTESGYSAIVGFRLGPIRNYLITDPTLLTPILNDYETFEKKSFQFNEARKMFDNGILFSNGKEWKHNRKIVNPAFHKKAIEGYLQVFATRGEELSRRLAEAAKSGEVNIYEHFVNTTVNVTLDIFFDYKLSKSDKDKIVKGIEDLLKYLSKRLLRAGLKFPDWIPVPENVAVSKAKEGYYEVIEKIIEEKCHNDPNENQFITIIDLLLNSESHFGGPMSPRQITSEASSIMLAGTETTASLLTWMFYELAKDEQVKSKVKEEIHTVLLKHPKTSMEALKELTYCRQVINEILRLYPPGWYLERHISEDVELGGVHFKKGSNFSFSPYILHHKEDIWPSADQFDPDRFHPTQLTKDQKEHFKPFSQGPRKCIGEEFSIWETLMIMIQVIPHFDWRLPQESSISVEFSATIRPVSSEGKYEVPMIINQS